MFRTFTVIVIACLISGLAGCRFCSSPYDYCSPTFTGNNYGFYHGDPCHPNYTAGSRFQGTEYVCRTNHCNTCSSGCIDCETEHFIPETSHETGTPVSKAAKPSVKSLPSSVKKIPNPPAAPQVAVPQAIQGVSTLKKNAQTSTVPQELSAPKPAVPQLNYAKQATQELSESAFANPDKMLNELRELNPDAVEVKIIGFEEQ